MLGQVTNGQKMVNWLKRSAKPIFGGGLLLIIAVNHSEEFRIRRRLRSGGYGVSSPPSDFSQQFCPYDSSLDMIEKVFEAKDGSFVGLVGPKSTGKSFTLENEASKEKYRQNSVFCKVNPNEYSSLTDVLYHRLYDGIWRLPYFLRLLKFDGGYSQNEMLYKLLGSVAESGERVRVFVDISAEEAVTTHGLTDQLLKVLTTVTTTEPFRDNLLEGSAIKNMFDQLMKLLAAESTQTAFHAESFIREVKVLVRDERLINCMFASNEVLMFETEAQREGRLTLFHSNELTVDKARIYLKELHKFDCIDEDLLLKFSRDFDHLRNFGLHENKALFTKNSLATHVLNIKQAISSCSKKDTAKSVKALLCLSLTRDIDIMDIINIGGMTNEEFISSFVDTNIFCSIPPVGTFTIQFDVNRLALKLVLVEAQLISSKSKHLND